MSLNQIVLRKGINKLNELIEKNDQANFIKKYCSIIDRLYDAFKTKTFHVNCEIWIAVNNYAKELISNKKQGPGLDTFELCIQRAKEIENNLFFVSKHFCFFFYYY